MKRILLAALATIAMSAHVPAAQTEDDLGARLRNLAANAYVSDVPRDRSISMNLLQMYQKRMEMRINCAVIAGTFDPKEHPPAQGMFHVCGESLKDFDEALEQVFFGRTPPAREPQTRRDFR